jgi:hypothetical protein
MALTAIDTYMMFLDGIKKSYTGTVKPEVFTRLMNDWGIDEWLKSNVSDEEGTETTSKQIDDLELLRVATDGEMIYNGDIMYEITPDTANGKIFSKPDGVTALNSKQPTVLKTTYPKFLRLLNVEFKQNYVSNICGLTGTSEWVGSQILRSSERSEILNNSLLKPTDSRLYYERINGKIKFINGTGSTGNSMRLEYLRYPKSFFFDSYRKIKALLTFPNAGGTGVATTLVVAIITPTITYTIPAITITANQTKYSIAKAVYDALVYYFTVTNLVSTMYFNLSSNTVGIGQTGINITSVIGTSTAGGFLTTPITATVGTSITDVALELPEQQQREVIRECVRIFLERIQDTRYKTYLNEEGYRMPANK